MRRSNKLLTLRKRLGLSQVQLAKAVGIPESTYFNLEKGINSGLDNTRNWSVAALKLAKFHRVPPEALFPRAKQIVKRRIVHQGIKSRELRLKRGLTQKELAEAAGVTLRCYIRLETGRTTPKYSRNIWTPTATKVAEYFGMTPEHLFGRVRRVKRRRG